VEEVPAEVVLLNHALRQGGLKFCSKRVHNKETFVHELERNPPDVILSDHGLASFDGFAALAIAREKRPGVPFIFVTGSLGEQKIIELFHRGATDCVLKHHLSELAPAVGRALRESEQRSLRKQKEQELRRSEELYRGLIECSPDAILVVWTKGQIAFVNPAAVKLLGASSANELIGTTVDKIFLPGQWEALVDRIRGSGKKRPSLLSSNIDCFAWTAWCRTSSFPPG
jgi:DNA-binding response OmpR family regulator